MKKKKKSIPEEWTKEQKSANIKKGNPSKNPIKLFLSIIAFTFKSIYNPLKWSFKMLRGFKQELAKNLNFIKFKKPKRVQFIINITFGLFIILALHYLESTRFGEEILNNIFDCFIQLDAEKAVKKNADTGDILLIDIGSDKKDNVDRSEINRKISLLSPRDTIAGLIKKAFDGGAGVIVLDFLFEEDDCCNPQGDVKLRNVLSENNDSETKVIFPVNVGHDKKLRKLVFDNEIDSNSNYFRAAPNILASQSDYTVRYWTAYEKYEENKVLWSIPVLTTALSQGTKSELKILEQKINGQDNNTGLYPIELSRKKGKKILLPVKDEDIFLQRIRYSLIPRDCIIEHPAGNIRYRTLENIEPEDLTNKIVIIGNSSTNVGDIHPTPIGDMPGMYIQANSIHTLLQGMQPKRAHWLVSLLMNFFVIVAAAYFFHYFKSFWADFILWILSTLGLGILVYLVFFRNYGIFPNFFFGNIAIGYLETVNSLKDKLRENSKENRKEEDKEVKKKKKHSKKKVLIIIGFLTVIVPHFLKAEIAVAWITKGYKDCKVVRIDNGIEKIFNAERNMELYSGDRLYKIDDIESIELDYLNRDYVEKKILSKSCLVIVFNPPKNKKSFFSIPKIASLFKLSKRRLKKVKGATKGIVERLLNPLENATLISGHKICMEISFKNKTIVFKELKGKEIFRKTFKNDLCFTPCQAKLEHGKTYILEARLWKKLQNRWLIRLITKENEEFVKQAMRQIDSEKMSADAKTVMKAAFLQFLSDFYPAEIDLYWLSYYILNKADFHEDETIEDYDILMERCLSHFNGRITESDFEILDSPGCLVNVELKREGEKRFVSPDFVFQAYDEFTIHFRTNFEGYTVVLNESRKEIDLVFLSERSDCKILPHNAYRSCEYHFDDESGTETYTFILLNQDSNEDMEKLFNSVKSGWECGRKLSREQTKILREISRRAKEKGQKMDLEIMGSKGFAGSSGTSCPGFLWLRVSLENLRE